MEDFLAELKARGAADLNSVMVTLNDGGLCRETLRHWIENGWVEVAPAMPLVALRGWRFSRELTLRTFCGEAPPWQGPPEDPIQEERQDDEHS